MARPSPQSVRRIACIGSGLMGGGWAVHFLAHGYDVIVQDPDPGAEAKFHRLLGRAWPALKALGVARGAPPKRVKFTTSVAEAVKDADFIQESAPERVPLKIKLLAEIDRLARPDVVISSSTSGFVISSIYGKCKRPQRVVVGHPFNPPYLMPLVEVGGGPKTSKDAIDWACRFYERTNMYALKMAVEVPGFIANRLQQALWYEALHMLADGQATVEQLDAALCEGPGLRWAMMGHFMLLHLAGGEGGIDHALEHFGSASNEEGYVHGTKPRMTPKLIEEIRRGVKGLVGRRSYGDLVRWRDMNLAGFRKVLEANKPKGARAVSRTRKRPSKARRR
ncbi:MAG: 3-hydroxyacyl-CoA dehydrogenase NAD-binding domain-containing protein [Alphaproteobacteria bacterium]